MKYIDRAKAWWGSNKKKVIALICSLAAAVFGWEFLIQDMVQEGQVQEPTVQTPAV